MNMRGARLREFISEQDSILPIMELVSSELTDGKVNKEINRQVQTLSAMKEKTQRSDKGDTIGRGRGPLNGVLSEMSLNPKGGKEPILRNTGEVFPGEGLAMPEPGGEEELGVFQKQETSPRDSTVWPGDKQ